ncbi:uncharacterized protein LOC123503476 [Portunus trituberculatus]|uniref:uncharacterized protein LOC123503476 n=1 Tax=Portunus trituberculatus TaxID=210409 RepID=UPI001E1D0B37|nr:uncharacterized protein LOC123503476 [Portunus trituberculatus]
MNFSRALLSLPLRRQTVIGALVMATVLYIVYQFIFVAELTESSRPQKHDEGTQQATRRRHQELVLKKHPKDLRPSKVNEIHDDAEVAADGNDNKNSDAEGKRDAVGKKTIAQNDIQNVEEVKGKQESKLTFQCEKSGKIISVQKLNDNYCDCPEDGSDEPRTNACANGRFTCLKHTKHFPESIPSGWVNDGVCDCCDGSDEWKMKKFEADLPLNLQKRIGRFLSPCPDQCPDAS